MYAPIPYPRMLYRFPEGAHTIVESEAEEAQARENGYVDFSEREQAEAPKPKAKKQLQEAPDDEGEPEGEEVAPVAAPAPAPARGRRGRKA